MKQSIFIRLNSLWTLVFLVFFAIILISVNPFEASIFLLILFYLVFFGLVFGILNLIGFYLKLPFWFRLLAAISLVFLLILQSFRF